MRRFCKPGNGVPKASKEALKLWNTEEGSSLSTADITHTCQLNSSPGVLVCMCILGDKLRKLLIKEGSFKNVELHLAKYKSHVEKDGRAGRWVTKAYLMEKYSYTKLRDCSNIYVTHRTPLLASPNPQS